MRACKARRKLWVCQSIRVHGSSGEVGEEFLDFGGGFAVVLLDGELQGVLQDGFGGGGLSVLKEGFTEEDAGEHPILAGGVAAFEVGDRGDGLPFFGEGLGEAETEEHVVGLGFDFSAEGFGFGHVAWKRFRGKRPQAKADSVKTASRLSRLKRW